MRHAPDAPERCCSERCMRCGACYHKGKAACVRRHIAGLCMSTGLCINSAHVRQIIKCASSRATAVHALLHSGSDLCERAGVRYARGKCRTGEGGMKKNSGGFSG